MAGEVTKGSYQTEDHLNLRIKTDQLSLGEGTKTASATSGAATLNMPSGVITSEALTTAAAATYTLTLTNSKIAVTDIVQVTLANGTNSAGAPCICTSTVTDSTITVVVKNVHATAALNGTLVFMFNIIKV